MLWRLGYGLLGLASASLIAAPASASSAPDRSIFGVASHFLHTSRFYPKQSQYWDNEFTLGLQRDLGNSWVAEQIYAFTARDRALVASSESSKAELDVVQNNRATVDKYLKRYDDAGLNVLVAVLAVAPEQKGAPALNADFAAWIGQLVASHPCIKAVQMHNEANLRSFWKGSPEDYVNTYRPIAEAVHKARGGVDVVVGAMSSLSWKPARDWFRRIVAAGALDYADAVAVHPYNTATSPEVDSFARDGDSPQSNEAAIVSFWNEVKIAGGAKMRLYFTEFGYAVAPKGLAVVPDEEMQAAYLGRLALIYQSVRLAGVPLQAVFWYDLKDDGIHPTNEQHHFGLVSFDNSRKKPAFQEYADIIDTFGDATAFTPSDVTVKWENAPFRVKSFVWKRKSDGALFVVFWGLGDSAAAGAEMQVTVAPAKISAASVRSPGTRSLKETNFSTKADETKIQVLVTDHASWVVLK